MSDRAALMVARRRDAAGAAALYEALARSGWFAPALMPTLPKVGERARRRRSPTAA